MKKHALIFDNAVMRDFTRMAVVGGRGVGYAHALP
jgi:hypothetical protein